MESGSPLAQPILRVQLHLSVKDLPHAYSEDQMECETDLHPQCYQSAKLVSDDVIMVG